MEELKQEIIAGTHQGSQHAMTGSATASERIGDARHPHAGIDKTFGAVRANRGASLEVGRARSTLSLARTAQASRL